MARKELTPRAWLALWSVYVIWGSTYLAIRYVVRTMPPLLTAGVRFLVAGLVMYTIGVLRGDRTDRPTLAHWRATAIIGTALCLGGNGLVNLAEARHLASGTAALIVATIPLWLALFDAIVFRARVRARAIAGLALGFAGAALLVRPGGAIEVRAALYVVAAAATWAAGSLYARRAPLPARPAVSSGMEMICGGVALVVAGIASNELSRVHPSKFSGASIAGLVYLIVFGSIVAFSAYVWLLRNVRTTIVGTYAYVNPFIAVLLGYVFVNERLNATTIVAGAVIVVAVALIVSVGPAPPKQADLGAERIVS
jgi:drug/metabolite transporter (DMT)-like permease